MMLQGIMAFLVGGGCGSVLLTVIACLLPHVSGDVGCGNVILMSLVLLVSAGFLPFLILATLGAKYLPPRRLWWLSFATGALHTPGLMGVSAVFEHVIGHVDSASWFKPIGNVGASLVAETVIFLGTWAMIMAVGRRRRVTA